MILRSLKRILDKRSIPGCIFRVHSFIPTFNKFAGITCNGLQLHITDPSSYFPVATAYEIFEAISQTTPPGSLKFNDPPYEYEYNLMPFDILSGDSVMRRSLLNGIPVTTERQRWQSEIEEFMEDFSQLSAYPE